MLNMYAAALFSRCISNFLSWYWASKAHLNNILLHWVVLTVILHHKVLWLSDWQAQSPLKYVQLKAFQLLQVFYPIEYNICDNGSENPFDIAEQIHHLMSIIGISQFSYYCDNDLWQLLHKYTLYNDSFVSEFRIVARFKYLPYLLYVFS